MNRLKTIQEITQNLTNFSNKVKFDNKQGLFDINVHAENFYCGLLNAIFNIQLINANYNRRTYILDLIDDTNRIGVEVTSVASIQKIQQFIHKIIEHKLFEKYNLFYFLIITEKQKNYKQEIFEKIQDKFKLEIIDNNDLIQIITTLPETRIASINEYIKDNLNKLFTYFAELIQRIKDIASSEKFFHQKIFDLYACSIDYEKNSKTSFTFAVLQNKFLFASTSKAASELIYERADYQKPNMGLTAWKNYPNGKISKNDVLISKNYLDENELGILNKLVSMIFDYAILHAQRQIPMKMSDLEKKINDLLNISEEQIITGKFTLQLAEQHAISEYEKYINSGAKIDINEKGNDYIYLRNLSIENLRTFGKRQTISFTDKDNKPNLWNIIIGDNGIGKTSILKALSLPLIRPWGNIDWIWKIDFRTFERYNSKMPLIDIEFEYNKSNSTQIDVLHLDVFTNRDLHYKFKNKQLDYEEQNKTEEAYSRTFLLFAYGASRHISTKGISVENDFSAQTIFDDNATLMNAEEWIILSDFKAKKDKKYSNIFIKIKEIIKLLLKDEIFDLDVKIINDTPKVLFKTQYGLVNLHELSLGYKTLLSWVIDFAKGMLEKYSESKNPLQEPAICLIDEIDLHIHPALQNKVIKFLSETFTKTQFIVTAHSPLIVQALENANIILLKDKEKSVEVQQNIIDIRNWRIDQILMSDLFGLQDVYSVETQIKLERRVNLLRKDSLTESEQIELAQLNEFVDNLPIGNNQNEIEGFALLRQFAQKIAKNQIK